MYTNGIHNVSFIINIEQKVNVNIGQFEEFQFP